jgi:hypothetical protein
MASEGALQRQSDSTTTRLTTDAQPQSAIAETSSAPLQSPNKPNIYQRIEDRFRLTEHVIKQIVQLIKQLEILAYTVVGFLGVLLILYYALYRQIADMFKDMLK